VPAASPHPRTPLNHRNVATRGVEAAGLVANAYLFLRRARAHARGTDRLEGTATPSR
jgi:hypothetical protein